MRARDPARLWGSWGFNPWVVGMLLGTGTHKAKAVIRSFQPDGAKQKKNPAPWHFALLPATQTVEIELGVGVRADGGDGLLGHWRQRWEMAGVWEGGRLPPHCREWAHSNDDQMQLGAGTPDRVTWLPSCPLIRGEGPGPRTWPCQGPSLLFPGFKKDH